MFAGRRQCPRPAPGSTSFRQGRRSLYRPFPLRLRNTPSLRSPLPQRSAPRSTGAPLPPNPRAFGLPPSRPLHGSLRCALLSGALLRARPRGLPPCPTLVMCPTYIYASCSVGLFVPAGTLHTPWGFCLSALPCVLNVWRLPTSALAGGHRLERCPAGGAPPPRPCARRGAPAPLLLVPAPVGRAPPRWPGLRESGVPLRGAFLSAGALGFSRGFGACAPASGMSAVRCVLALLVRSPVLTPKARALLDVKCLGPSKKNVYTTGFPLPTSAEPVFFGNLPCDI